VFLDDILEKDITNQIAVFYRHNKGMNFIYSQIPSVLKPFFATKNAKTRRDC